MRWNRCGRRRRGAWDSEAGGVGFAKAGAPEVALAMASMRLEIAAASAAGRCVESSLPRDCADRGEEVEQDAAAGELLQQQRAEGGEDEIGSPHAEERRELAGLGEGDAERPRAGSR